MRELLAELVQTKEVIEANAKHIARLQKQVVRLQKKGGDEAQVKALLSQFHALHLQVLAVQSLLLAVLAKIDPE